MVWRRRASSLFAVPGGPNNNKCSPDKAANNASLAGVSRSSSPRCKWAVSAAIRDFTAMCQTCRLIVLNIYDYCTQKTKGGQQLKAIKKGPSSGLDPLRCLNNGITYVSVKNCEAIYKYIT